MTVTKLLTKQAGNANLDNVFDPYVQGTSPAATGLLNDAGTTDIATLYAPIVFGSAAAATGLLTKQAGNADVNTLFAKIGTAVYTLPINGRSYTEGVGRSTAYLNFNIKDDGTYSITSQAGASAPVVQDSGTWLPAGTTVSQWKYNYTQVGFTSGADPGGGVNGYSGASSTPATIVGTETFQATAAASVFQTASNAGSVTLHLTKTGGGTIVTTVHFDCEAAG